MELLLALLVLLGVVLAAAAEVHTAVAAAAVLLLQALEFRALLRRSDVCCWRLLQLNLRRELIRRRPDMHRRTRRRL